MVVVKKLLLILMVAIGMLMIMNCDVGTTSI